MDTVQNISGVIVGSNSGSVQQTSPPASSRPPNIGDINVVNAVRDEDIIDLDRPRRAGRQEFLSRPSWLFGINENILFCTALEALRFPDQNNVPRKFIEERFSDIMVTMNSEWPAGQRFLTETIAQLKSQPARLAEKQRHGMEMRQKEFHNTALQAVKRAEKKLQLVPLDQREACLAELEKARKDAAVPMQEISVFKPTVEEIVLVELQTKIVRRIQGQTDRIYMAEQLAGRPYENPGAEYFINLQNEILKEIDERHVEIVASRDKVDPKSKLSRMRRRNQVTNGSTMSGSATRVRFTNREIAMLIHWIYSYPKSAWTAKINEFYVEGGVIRSPEHVRDKMRDLITRSRDTENGGLLLMRVRKNNVAKYNDPPEVQALCMSDIEGFRYPYGALDFVPSGMYFDEDAKQWVKGPLPSYYPHKYVAEVDRIRNVVKSKSMRKPEKSFGLLEMSLHHSALMPNGAYQSVSDSGLLEDGKQLGGQHSASNFDIEGLTKANHRHKDYDIEALATAALNKTEYLQFGNSAESEHDSKYHNRIDVSRNDQLSAHTGHPEQIAEQMTEQIAEQLPQQINQQLPDQINQQINQQVSQQSQSEAQTHHSQPQSQPQSEQPEQHEHEHEQPEQPKQSEQSDQLEHVTAQSETDQSNQPGQGSHNTQTEPESQQQQPSSETNSGEHILDQSHTNVHSQSENESRSQETSHEVKEEEVSAPLSEKRDSADGKEKNIYPAKRVKHSDSL